MEKSGKFSTERAPANKKRKKRKIWPIVLVTIILTVILTLVLETCAVYVFQDQIKNYVLEKFGEKIGDGIGTADTTPPEETLSDEELEILMGVFESTEVTIPEEETIPDYGQTGKVVNILVVGQAGRAEEVSKLADTIMLFSLNKETHVLTVTSFLRDSWVDLPDYWGHTCGWNRVNTAYALGYNWAGDAGAMEMLNITLKNNFNVAIDGDIEISFESFETVVDVLGGVDVELSGSELTYMNDLAVNIGCEPEFVEGSNHMVGFWALHYARMRHAGDDDSDIRRAARQRGLIQQIMEKMKELSLSELNSLIDTILPMVITNISKEDIITYVTELTPYLFDLTLEANQCPKEKSYWGEIEQTPDGPAGVLKIDFGVNQRNMRAICTGEY